MSSFSFTGETFLIFQESKLQKCGSESQDFKRRHTKQRSGKCDAINGQLEISHLPFNKSCWIFLTAALFVCVKHTSPCALNRHFGFFEVGYLWVVFYLQLCRRLSLEKQRFSRGAKLKATRSRSHSTRKQMPEVARENFSLDSPNTEVAQTALCK